MKIEHELSDVIGSNIKL